MPSPSGAWSIELLNNELLLKYKTKSEVQEGRKPPDAFSMSPSLRRLQWRHLNVNRIKQYCCNGLKYIILWTRASLDSLK